MTAYKCTICNDTGKRAGSDYLDCSCGAAEERMAMNDFVSETRVAGFTTFADLHWSIHQRATRIAEESALNMVQQYKAQIDDLDQQNTALTNECRGMQAEKEAQAARIDELEAQLAEASAPSAPAVEQQPFGYFREMLSHEGKGNGVYVGVTKKDVSEKGHIPGETSETMIELYAKPQAADTDKVREAARAVLREALDAAEVHPCDTNNDSARAKQLTPLMQNLYKAMHSMAAQAPVREVPENWQLVPIKATPAMVDAYNATPCGIAGSPAHGSHVWDAMIAAAPLPAAPVQQEGE